MHGVSGDRTISGNIRPRLSKQQSIRIHAMADHVADASPVDGDGVALEEIGEEKADGPDEVNSDHDPDCRLDPSALEDSSSLLAFLRVRLV